MFTSPLVSPTWLADHHEEVRLVDVRWYLDGRSGRAAYDAGHLPGAVFADLDTDLSAPPSASGGRHPLPAPDAFATALGLLGIDETTPVVAYDDAGGAIAARLWWMLHVLGHPAAVLDGGIDAWGGELTTEASDVAAVDCKVREWPEHRFRSADDVAAGRFDVLIDSRSAERYRGDDTTVDPRPGHVPGARSAPFAGNLTDGALRPVDQLVDRFADLDVATDTQVVAYCGSGVTACHNLLALELAGIEDTALFVGSSSAWAGDPDRPVVSGAEPG